MGATHQPGSPTRSLPPFRSAGLFRGKAHLLLILVIPAFLYSSSSTEASIFEEAPQLGKAADAARELGRSWSQKLPYIGTYSSSYGNAEQPIKAFSEQDGLLYFTPAAAAQTAGRDEEGVDAGLTSMVKRQHPILHLMETAQQNWDNMLARQSRTLSEAVTEYKRRFNRPPPLGFDVWWRYCEENNVQLPDEYDTIMDHLEPFFALPPATFKARADILTDHQSIGMSRSVSFSLNVRKHEVELQGPGKSQPRATTFGRFLKPIAQYLPDLAFAVTLHDGANVMISGEAKQKYIEYARQGKFLTQEEAEDQLKPPSVTSWAADCYPGSNIRRFPHGHGLQRPATRSFVTDVVDSSDLCKNPDITSLHGLFLRGSHPISRLYPYFAWTKATVYSDILVTPLEQYWFKNSKDEPVWDDKNYNKMVWRGSSTGIAWTKSGAWRSSQRARLVQLGQDEGYEKKVHYADEDGALQAVIEPVEQVSARTMDAAFTGKPILCEKKDGTCEVVGATYNYTERMSTAAQNEYKYIFDMDGNGWSGRYHRLLMSNSAILKSTAMPEWYQKRIMPWLHFIPVKIDYSDLHDILAFFIGDSNGENGHDELGKKIAEQGKEWAATYWREVDMRAYMLRLLLEYSRLYSRTEDDLDAFDYKASV